MRHLSPSTLLLISGCLLASGCTEKTTINEAASAAVATPGVETSPAPGSTTDISINADSEVQIDTTPAMSDPVSNMIDPSTTTTADPPTTAFPDAVINPTPGAPNSTSPLLPTTDVTPVSNDPLTPATSDTPASGDPLTPATSDTPVSGDPLTPATGNTPVSSDPLTPVIGNPLVPVTGESQTSVPTDTSPAVVDPVIPGTITGIAGMTVDCEQTVPCKWISADTGFSVTVSNVDNTGRLNRLRIDYSIITTHDTLISFTGANSVVDGNGASLTTTAVSIGSATGGVAQGVVAGNELPGSMEFNDSSTSDSLSSWSIGLSDSGLTRTPTFTNLPIGSLTTQIADCENILPCVWIPPNGEVTVTLLAVSGTGDSNLLTTNFSVVTTRTATIALDSGATAVGTDGLSYRGRTHTIAQQTGSEKLTVNTVAGAQVVATVFFFRTQSMSAALQNLSLITYEDNPVPRWNPMFTNVPVQ